MGRLPDPARTNAVLIGSSTYQHLPDLPAVRNNLQALAGVLTDATLGGLSAERCTVVSDPADVPQVYRTLRRQAGAAEDLLLLYFAGHGRLGRRNELHLCLPGTDPDELWFTALPYEQVRAVLADCPAANRVVILDCCFSGRAIGDLAGGEETLIGQLGIEGTYILAATAGNALALAPAGQRYTAFTDALLTVLRRGIPDGPPLLTFGAVYPRLRALLASRGMPLPRQQGTDTVGQLALTRNPAARDAATAAGETHQDGLRPGLDVSAAALQLEAGEAMVGVWTLRRGQRGNWLLLTTNRLIAVAGEIPRRTESVPLHEITDMRYEQGPAGRAFNYGTLVLEIAHDRLSRIDHVNNPAQLYLSIVDAMYEPGVAARRLDDSNS